MGLTATGTGAREAGPAGQQPPGTVRLAGMLTLSCLASQAGRTTVTFAGELDAASAGQAYEYVREAIDAHGGQVRLDVAGLRFCDARGLGALVRMSVHAAQAGSSLHLVAPPPLLKKLIRITGLGDQLPAHRRGPGRARAGSVSPPVPPVVDAHDQYDQFTGRRGGFHGAAAQPHSLARGCGPG